MARKKLRMELIEKEKTREATLKKRLQSLKKKAYEFSVLCDVDICMIIFTPELNYSPNVEAWPLDPIRVDAIIHRYKQTMAASGSQKRTFGISDFFDMRRRQVWDEVAQVCKANFEAKFPTWDDRIDNFSAEQITSCLAKLNSNIEVVKSRIMLMKGDDKHKLLQSARSRPSTFDNFNIPSAALHPWNRHRSDNQIKSFSRMNSEFGVIGEQPPPLSVVPVDIHDRPSLSPADEALVKLSLSLNNDLDFGVQSGVASSSNSSIPNNVMYYSPPPPSFFVHPDPIYGMPNNDVMFDPISSIPVLHDPSRSSTVQNYAMGTWFNAAPAPAMQPVEVSAYNQRQQLMMPHVFHQMLPSDFNHEINEYEMKNKKQRFF